MPTLIKINQLCEETDENGKQKIPEVTCPKHKDKNKFHKDGLFSEHIFGPIKNYTCQCGTFHGSQNKGTVCETCGVPIEHSRERRIRFAKIKIPITIFNPMIYDLVVQIGGSQVKEIIQTLMSNNEDYVVYELDDKSISIVKKDNAPEGRTIYEGLEAVKIAVLKLAEIKSNSDTKEASAWKLILENIDNLITNYILVLPPDLRPMVKGLKQSAADSINRYYTQLLTRRNVVLDTMVDINRNRKTYKFYYSMFQRDVNELYKHIIERLGKKKGLIRNNILGKRIDFSGRAVIVPEPRLNLNECVIPYRLFLEIFKLKIAKRLLHIGETKMLNTALLKIEKCIDSNHPELLPICEYLAENLYCILNRQPSLHRLSLLGFKIKVDLDNVIKLHPLVCNGFNADFDGDQMAVYIPITDEAVEEVKNKLLVTNNLLSPSNSNLVTLPSQDIILGLYILTANLGNDEELLKKIIYKEKEITFGQKLFNECFPNDMEVIDYPITKKGLVEILNRIMEKYDVNQISNILDNLKLLGFEYSTLFGPTLSLKSFYLPEIQKIRDEIFDDKDIAEIFNKTTDPELIDKLREQFQYAFMIDSGARGSWDQAKQMLFSRAFVSDFSGKITENPIKHSLLEGLTPKELFESTYGCRKGLLDVALNTGASGYLSRKLIFCCVNLLIDESIDDCGTQKYLELYVNDERKAEMLILRYHYEDKQLKQITRDNYKEIIGKTILLRSPVYCKSKDICKKCYGDLYKIVNSRFIGIVAAQALGETNTQLVLRTFHTSGSATRRANVEENDVMQQEDIISDLSKASKILHKFDGTCEELIQELFEIYNFSKKIHHVHFEVVVSQLLWHDDEKWRLIKDRENKAYNITSIQTVPTLESWLHGLGFSKPKQHILRGVLKSGNYRGILDNILRGKKIES